MTASQAATADLHVVVAAQLPACACRRLRKVSAIAGCYKAWRYCTNPRHSWERILPAAAMSNTTKCRTCARAAQRKRNGSAVCERCGNWVNTEGRHSPKRTVCVSCWEGVEGCIERSGECSQPPARIIAGRCTAHYLRAYSQGRMTSRPCLQFDVCGGYATAGPRSLFCDPCVEQGWEHCGPCGALYQRTGSIERYANGKMKRRNTCTECAKARCEAARRARGVRPATVAQCGTLGGCDRHRRNGEPLCDKCKAAWRDYQRGYRRRHGRGQQAAARLQASAAPAGWPTSGGCPAQMAGRPKRCCQPTTGVGDDQYPVVTVEGSLGQLPVRAEE
jgi:hypothetical protein